MLREYIAEGKTVEEAIEKGCAELGIDSYDALTEILEMPKKGFFGKIKSPAKVKVSFDDGVEEKKPEKKKKPAPKKDAPKKDAQGEKKQPKKADKVEKTDKTEKADVKTESAPKKEDKPVNTGDRDKKIAVAQEYLNSMLVAMGLTAVEIKAEKKEDGVVFTLEGEDLGVVIGRRGETLDALQYLTSLVCNRIDSGYYRVTIDCGDFRIKREQTLKELAEKIAKTVLRTGRSTTLEPMNPYERRIIHAVIAETEGVFSRSVGDEPYRKVVISAPGAKGGRGGNNRGGRGNGDRRGRGGNNRGGRGGRPRADRAPAPQVDPNREKLVDTPDATLYGKIEL